MDVEAICSGWLTKSPSSKYVTLFSKGKLSIRVPLKSKWHRRYFVLHKPHGSLPHQYAFDYFKDETGGRRRGSINLEECETILSGLDTSHYQHLFSIKTKSRNKDRVYYLAAESDEDMTRWVNYLCRLCGLKIGPTDVAVHTENHAPNPPVRLDSMQLTVDLGPNQAISNQSLVDEELSNQILEEIDAIEQGRLEVDSRPQENRIPMGYTELADCTTGESSRASGDMVDLYDVPRRHNLAPPKRIGQSHSVKGHKAPHMSGGISGSRSANSSPRPSRTVYTPRPVVDPMAPPRPPKPGQQSEELYENIGSNSPHVLRTNISPQSDNMGKVSSPSFTRIHHRHQNSAPERFIFPSTVVPVSLGVTQTNHVSSSANSPVVNRRTNSSGSVTSPPAGQGGLTSPPVNGRASPSRNISVDSIYHNTAVLSPPPSGGSLNNQPLYSNGDTANSQSGSRKDMDSVYDVPKSLNVSLPIAPPSSCSRNTTTTIHKYVNATAGIITHPVRDNQNNDINRDGDLSKEKHLYTNGEGSSSAFWSQGTALELSRQPVNENHYDIAPGMTEEMKPNRPPKPRNLSDPTALEDDNSSHQVLKVSKSFRTQAFTKDNVFSDESDENTVNMTRSVEEIKLPCRINTNDNSSTDSSSEEEDESDSNSNTTTSPRIENVYDVPSSVPRPLHPQSRPTQHQPPHQPQLPERLHHRNNKSATIGNHKTVHSNTVANIMSIMDEPPHVKRSSSMSKVPMPPGSLAKLPSGGGGHASPKMKNLRSERSSSVSTGTNDWRMARINAPNMALTGIKSPLPPPIEPLNDIQYVELDTSEDKGAEPSPLSNRGSLSSVIPVGLGANNKSPELEYTDIDILKTQALTVTRRERDMNLRKRSENDNID